MLGSNLSACRVSIKGAEMGRYMLPHLLFNPLENQSGKSQGFGGGAPECHLL